MAEVSPFRSFRFDVAQLSGQERDRLVSTPYVGIEQEDHALPHVDPDLTHFRTWQGSRYPNAFVQDNVYTHTRQRILGWLSSGVLTVDVEPSFYIYHESFLDPHGRPRTRKGLIGRVRLHDYDEQIILPHERTLNAPKVDRLHLMKATQANLNQVFMLYHDPQHALDELLEECRLAAEPLMSLTTHDDILHELWGVSQPETVALISAFFDAQQLLIADGHHRYETALHYREYCHETRGEDPEAPCEHIMTMLVNMHDPGLLVLPTHRVVHSVPHFDPKRLIQALHDSPTYDVTVLPEGLLDEPRQLLLRCEQAGERAPSFVCMIPGERAPVLISFTGDATSPIFDPETPALLRGLDVTILHEGILDRLLGIDKAAQAAKTNLRYKKRLAEAMDELKAPDTQMVVLMNATPVNHIHEVCQSGGKMPQKSTYFYPKILSGLMLCPLS